MIETDPKARGSKHFAGYHGTSLDDARLIARHGFRDDMGLIYFAPMHGFYLARYHGRRRADERGHKEYAVVLANFPAHKLVLGMDGDQLEIPPELADKIRIVQILAWKVDGGLESSRKIYPTGRYRKIT